MLEEKTVIGYQAVALTEGEINLHFSSDILNIQNFTQPYFGWENKLRQKERKHFQNLNCKKLP